MISCNGLATTTYNQEQLLIKNWYSSLAFFKYQTLIYIPSLMANIVICIPNITRGCQFDKIVPHTVKQGPVSMGNKL